MAKIQYIWQNLIHKKLLAFKKNCGIIYNAIPHVEFCDLSRRRIREGYGHGYK